MNASNSSGFSSDSVLAYAVDMSYSNLVHLFYNVESALLPADVTPLMIAAARNDLAAIEEHVEEYHRKTTRNGVTALMFAAILGSKNTVERLIGLEGGLTDCNGRTALMLAAENRQISIIRLLMPYEAKQQDLYGTTALMISVCRNHMEGVQELIGYESGMQNKKGFTALMLAAERDFFKIVRVLLSREARMSTHKGITALMMAATCNRRISARILALKEAGMQCNMGWTALMMAANNGNADIVELLRAEEGGLQTNNGVTALMNATIHHHVPVIRLLIDQEARLTDIKGQSATMLAASEDYYEGVRELGRYEAGLINNEHKTAYIIARDCGHQRIVDYLEALEGDSVSQSTKDALGLLSSSLNLSTHAVSVLKNSYNNDIEGCEKFTYTPDASNFIPVSPLRNPIDNKEVDGPKRATACRDDVSISDLFYSKDILPSNIPTNQHIDKSNSDYLELNKTIDTSPGLSRLSTVSDTLGSTAIPESNKVKNITICDTLNEILPIHQNFRSGVKNHLSTTLEITRLIAKLKDAHPQALTLITALQRHIGLHLQFTSALVDFVTETIGLSEDQTKTKEDLYNSLLKMTRQLDTSESPIIKTPVQSVQHSPALNPEGRQLQSNINKRSTSIRIMTERLLGRILGGKNAQE